MRWLDVLFLSIGILLLFIGLATIVMVLTYLERKFLARVQTRLGPMHTGPFGLLQPVADTVKLVLKEDLTPGWANRFIFWVAPMLLAVPALMIWLAIPAGRELVIYKIPDATNLFELGLLYILAIAGLSTLGMVLAGWSSSNKYSAMGALRSAAQMVSYEVPLIMAVVGVALLAGSINLEHIVDAQVPGTVGLPATRWPHAIFAVIQPLGLFIFLIAMLAEVGRTPFDILQAESEIVSGPFAEYSSGHWAAFFLAEYINTFTVGALFSILFLGGWHGPLLPGWLWFLIKTFFMVIVILWIRGTFPRLRVDQLMSFSWKVLIPLSFANIVVTAIVMYYGWPAWVLTLLSGAITIGAGYLLYRHISKPAKEARAYVYRRREVA
jgi:NADH-quinone oxidoreductase subunit H